MTITVVLEIAPLFHVDALQMLMPKNKPSQHPCGALINIGGKDRNSVSVKTPDMMHWSLLKMRQGSITPHICRNVSKNPSKNSWLNAQCNYRTRTSYIIYDYPSVFFEAVCHITCIMHATLDIWCSNILSPLRGHSLPKAFTEIIHKWSPVRSLSVYHSTVECSILIWSEGVDKSSLR